jgi:TPR repeat protein
MGMRQCFFFPFLVLPMVVPWAAALPQAANAPPKAELKSKSRLSKPDEKILLVRAEQGDASSQMWLGAAYEQGWFGKSNFPEALKWFRKSAEHGDPDAQTSLGQMYEYGKGVTQNYSLAAQWYRKAAEHDPDWGGAGQGRNHLGMLYLDGKGVQRDYVQAYMWFRLADVEANLSFAKAHMTPEQILEAERLAEEWKSRHARPK